MIRPSLLKKGKILTGIILIILPYNDSAYKVVSADKVLDLGLYEDVVLKNGRTVQRKAKGVLKQRIIITFSRKMMEYQRTVRNRQIERAKKLLALKDPKEIKKVRTMSKRFMKRVSKNKIWRKSNRGIHSG